MYSRLLALMRRRERKFALIRAVLFVCLMIPAIVIVGIGLWSTYRFETRIATELNAARADLFARVLGGRIQNLVELSRSISTRPAPSRLVSEGKWEEAAQQLASVQPVFPFVAHVFLTDLSGAFRSDYPLTDTLVGTSFSESDWYRGMGDDWRPYVSGVYAHPVDPAIPVVAFPSSVTTTDGRVVGLFVMEVRASVLADWMVELETETGEVLSVVDQNGLVVAEIGRDGADVGTRTMGEYEPAAKARSGLSGQEFVEDSADGTDRLASFVPVSSIGWGVVLERRTEDVFATRDLRMARDAALYAVILALNALLAIWVMVILRISSDRELLAQRLRQEEKFRAVFDHAQDGILIVDLRTRKFVEGNAAVCAMLGYSKREILRLGVRDIHPKESLPHVLEQFERQARGEFPVAEGLPVLRRDGTVFLANIGASPVTIDGRAYMIGIFRDVTREREVDRAKSEFVSLTSHQLRTPLTTIRWYVEMLVDGKAGPVSGKQERYLTEVHRGTMRMIELVGAFLDVSRLELGTFVFEAKDANVRGCAQAVLEDLRPQMKKRALSFRETYGTRLPDVAIDPKLLRVVLQNILTNAIKYTPNKGRVTLSVSTDRERRNVVVTIADTGCGIPKSQQRQIFTKLFRADNVRQMDTEGTGLGLYIAKAIIDRSGGTIRFESEENKGTTFYITLPASGAPSYEEEHHAHRGGRTTVAPGAPGEIRAGRIRGKDGSGRA